MRSILYFLSIVLLIGCASTEDESQKYAQFYTDRVKAPSIEVYGIDQTENKDAGKWLSTKSTKVGGYKYFSPIVRIEPRNQNNLNGWAIFTFTVDEQGKTTDITLIDEEPIGTFSKEAVKALSKFRYKPYSPDGTPKKVRNVWHTFEFKKI